MKKKIIYIAGYSRSGSTILDILLSSHIDIFGTGELVYLFDDWMDGSRACTCGEIYSKCIFWKNFMLPQGITMQEANDIIRSVESRKRVPLLVSDKIAASVIEKYKLIQSALYNYIAKTAGKDIIVDSSKTSRDMAGRFYALNKYTDFDVYVIHLVKDGLSIVESYVKKGRNWAIEGHVKNDRFLAARSSLGWRLANDLAQRLGLKMKGKYIQIRYEDLISQPQATLQKLGTFLNINLDEVIEIIKNKKPLHPQHNVGGNRLRLEKEIVFKPSEGGTKKRKLEFLHQLTFKIIAGNKNKKFGY